MNYKETLMILVNKFNEIKKYGDFNNELSMLKDKLAKIKLEIDSLVLTEEDKKAYMDVITKFDNKIQQFELESTKNYNQNINSYFENVSKETEDIYQKVKRALLKEEEYGERLFVDEDLLKGLIREYKNLKSELLLPNMDFAFSLKPAVREELINKLDKKILDLTNIDKTYNGNDFGFGGTQK